MNKAIEICTIDKQRKNLYSKELKKKIISKSIYLYIYVPIRKAPQAAQFESEVLSNFKNSKLVNLFSTYTFFHTYPIQGPRIHLLITKSLFFDKIKELQEASIFICFFNLKWYAFFLLVEINFKYQLLFKLCFDFKLNAETNFILLFPHQK